MKSSLHKSRNVCLPVTGRRDETMLQISIDSYTCTLLVFLITLFPCLVSLPTNTN